MGRKKAFEVLSGRPQSIPGDLDMLIAGFSCKVTLKQTVKQTVKQSERE